MRGGLSSRMLKQSMTEMNSNRDFDSELGQARPKETSGFAAAYFFPPEYSPLASVEPYHRACAVPVVPLPCFSPPLPAAGVDASLLPLLACVSRQPPLVLALQ